jgi:hypothetical protein
LSAKFSAFRDSAGVSLASAGALSDIPVSGSIARPVSTLQSAIPCHTFMFIINGRQIASNLVEAMILSPAVTEQLLGDSSTRFFVICNNEICSADFSSLYKLVSGNEIIIRQSSQKSPVLLSRLLFNTALEHFFFSLWFSGPSLSDEMTVIFETVCARTSVSVAVSQFDVRSIGDLSLSSIDALNDLLSNDSLRVESEDPILTRLS